MFLTFAVSDVLFLMFLNPVRGQRFALLVLSSRRSGDPSQGFRFGSL